MRQALRSLLRSPGYTAIALLTLALGIGVNTSMFSVVDALLFRSAPFPGADRLVQVMGMSPQGEARTFSEIELREVRGQAGAFESLSVIGGNWAVTSEPGQPAERIPGIMFSDDAFTTFGVAPLLGRAFSPEEYQPGRNNVILLSHAFWQQRHGGRSDIIGQSMRLDGEPVTIVGVMPPQFDYRMLWGNAAFFRPLNYTKEQLDWRDYRAFRLIGRLKPDATPARVSAELAPIAAEQQSKHPDLYTGRRYVAVPLHEALMDDLGRNISWMLLGLSGFVLLIACANLANLQLARATAGLRELAIRAALGASRRRLIAQQLVESVLLSLGGGLLGLGLAFVINRIVDRNFRVGGSGGALDVALDGRILALTLLISLLTGVLFGLAPAWFASRTDVNTHLKAQARGSTPGRGHHRVRQTLIVVEVALALVLLGGAAVLQRGFARLLERQAGWDTDHILTATLPLPANRYGKDPQRIELFRKLEDRLAALPGVEHAAIATSLPIFSYNGDRQVLLEGQTPGDAATLPTAFHVMVTPSYFETMGISLVEGRLWTRDVKPRDPLQYLINESFARRLWPNQSAIGRRLAGMDSGKPYWGEVIGVVRDVDVAANTQDPSTPFQVYKSLNQEPWGYVYLIVRSRAPAALAETVRRAIADVDPDLATAQSGTVRQLVDQQQHNLVLAAKTLTWFAALGLLLAAIGLYGVISNLVAQRTSEFGIRLALGAQPGDVLSLVLKHGIALTLIGLAVGLAGAYALARFLNSLMPRLATPDPLALGVVALLLLVTAILACWLPARRATKVDPLIALRAE